LRAVSARQIRKGGFPKEAAFLFSFSLFRSGLVAASGGGAGAAGAAAATAHGILGIHGEAVVGHVDANIPGIGEERFLDHHFKSLGLELFVVVVQLIQSQRKFRAGSAARSKVDPDGLDFLALEVIVELLLCSGGDFDHGSPPYSC
jgi:hypothetical protein